MLTSFGFYYLLGTVAFALLLTTPLFYDDLKWDFKKNILPYLGLTAFLFFGWLFITDFLCGSDVAVTKTEWRTIHPNHDKVTVEVRTGTSNYITVTPKTKQNDVEDTNTIKLTQRQYVKEKTIDHVIIDGSGKILDKVQYGTETTQQAFFGIPIFTAKGHRSALRFVYKEPSSNKTLDDMLK